MPSLTVKSSDFARAVSAAKSIILSRTTVPLLQCVAITAEGGAMRVAATDLNSGVATSIPCVGTGNWALPYDRLAAFSAAMPKGKDVTMTGDQIVTLRCGSVSARIPSLDVKDFPNLHVNRPASLDVPTFSDGRVIAAMARMAVLCDDGTGSQLFMQGIRVLIDGTKGRLSVATSSRGGWLDFETDALSTVDALVTADAVTSLASLFEKVAVSIAQSGNAVWFSGGGCEFVTKSIDASYPADLGIVPDHDGKFTVDADSLNAAIGAVAGLTDKSTNAIILRVSPNGSFIAVNSGDGGMMCVPFDCEAGSEWDATLSASVLKGSMAAIGKSTIGMAMCAGVGAVTQRHLHFISDGYLGVAMPLRGKPGEAQAAIDAFESGHSNREAIAA
jgi:DNA polymerase-3 subunit beta